MDLGAEMPSCFSRADGEKGITRWAARVWAILHSKKVCRFDSSVPQIVYRPLWVLVLTPSSKPLCLILNLRSLLRVGGDG